MEDILTQRYRYARITSLKDYCLLEDKNDYLEAIEMALNYIPFDPKPMCLVLRPKPLKGKKTKFHYGSNNEENEKIFCKCTSSKKSSFLTTKNSHIVRHFSNPYSSIEINTIERSIRRHGDKLTIKIYRGSKVRNINSKFFKKMFNVVSITINLKTGNFYLLHLIDKGKTFRTNDFNMLERFLKLIFTDNMIGFSLENDVNFIRELYSFFNFTSDGNKNIGEFISHFSKWFVDMKKIKVPNNFKMLISNFYPTEKFFKKNERKLIASVLDFFKIKSKYTIKLLHEIEEINLRNLVSICGILGDNFSKYLYNLKKDFFIDKETFLINKYELLNSREIFGEINLTEKEKENVCSIINSMELFHGVSFGQSIRDHKNMINKIREYIPDVNFNARTDREFRNEHRELSRLYNLIKRGYKIKYDFSEVMLNEIEQPIDVNITTNEDEIIDVKTFYPYVLKCDDDYKEEGDFMHHCVNSYSEYVKSVIISIRTKNMDDRVTCEFNAETGKLLQAKHFCNASPPKEFNDALEQLIPKVKKMADKTILKSIEKKKISLKTNEIIEILENADETPF